LTLNIFSPFNLHFTGKYTVVSKYVRIVHILLQQEVGELHYLSSPAGGNTTTIDLLEPAN